MEEIKVGDYVRLRAGEDSLRQILPDKSYIVTDTLFREDHGNWYLSVDENPACWLMERFELDPFLTAVANA